MTITLPKPEVVRSATTEGRSHPPRNGRGWLRSLVWLAVSIAAAIVGLECIFAAAHLGEEEFGEAAPIIGFWHIPNRLVTWRSEGYSQGRLNADGLRDVPMSVQKPPGVKRIAVIGDSMAEGLQVDGAKTFPKVLEQILNRDGIRAEVMNFGMSGLSTVQAMYLFREKIAKYKPDLCILAYHQGDNEKNTYSPSAESSLPRPYCTIGDGSILKTDWTCYDRWTQGDAKKRFTQFNWLVTHSRICALLAKMDQQLSADKTYGKLKQGFFNVSDRLIGKKTQPPVPIRQISTAEEFGLPAQAYDLSCARLPNFIAPNIPVVSKSPPARDVLDSWEISQSWRHNLSASAERFAVTAAVISTFQDLCKKHNCSLVVADLPAPNNSMLYFRELIMMRKLADQRHMPFISVRPDFPSLAPMEKSRYYYDIHFTEDGHALVANSLYRGFKTNGLLEQLRTSP